VEIAIKLLKESKKPLIYVGGGVVRSGASEELKKFAERLNAPVTSSLMGLGGFPSTHKLFTGMLGMHGTKTSNLAATQCDLLIAVGARFSDRAIGKVEGFALDAKILQIDIDQAEINKNIRINYSITKFPIIEITTINPR